MQIIQVVNMNNTRTNLLACTHALILIYVVCWCDKCHLVLKRGLQGRHFYFIFLRQRVYPPPSVPPALRRHVVINIIILVISIITVIFAVFINAFPVIT